MRLAISIYCVELIRFDTPGYEIFTKYIHWTKFCVSMNKCSMLLIIVISIPVI